jgi:hypothetical protein
MSKYFFHYKYKVLKPKRSDEVLEGKLEVEASSLNEAKKKWGERYAILLSSIFDVEFLSFASNVKITDEVGNVLEEESLNEAEITNIKPKFLH